LSLPRSSSTLAPEARVAQEEIFGPVLLAIFLSALRIYRREFAVGPAPARPYHATYFPGPRWYRWWDFGNGTMSDLGSHDNDVPYTVLDLKRPNGTGEFALAPLTIEAFSPNVPLAHKELAPATMKVTYDFRKNIAEKVKRIPLKYFDTKTHGEVLSRVTNDIDTINQTLTQNLSQVVTSVTTIIGVLVMMFSISWLMTIVALLILPISTVLVSRVIKSSQKYFQKQQIQQH
jgi:hypothetical protein